MDHFSFRSSKLNHNGEQFQSRYGNESQIAVAKILTNGLADTEIDDPFFVEQNEKQQQEKSISNPVKYWIQRHTERKRLANYNRCCDKKGIILREKIFC